MRCWIADSILRTSSSKRDLWCWSITTCACQAAATQAKLPPAEAAALREGIERLLALDAEIRSHTDPFLSSVRKLLSAGRQERALRNAYGALAR